VAAASASDRLTRMQHDHLDGTVSATHVHLDHGNCLEVIVLRGEAARVRAIGHKLAGARGVKHGNLTCTTTGAALP